MLHTLLCILLRVLQPEYLAASPELLKFFLSRNQLPENSHIFSVPSFDSSVVACIHDSDDRVRECNVLFIGTSGLHSRVEDLSDHALLFRLLKMADQGCLIGPSFLKLFIQSLRDRSAERIRKIGGTDIIRGKLVSLRVIR